MIELNQDKFVRYDQVTNLIYQNLYTLNKSNATINLYGYDNNDDAHKLIFEIAKALSYLTNKRLTMDSSLFMRIKLFLKFHKNIFFIKRAPAITTDTITIPEMISFMQNAVNEIMDVDNFNIGVIYNAYYKKG